MNTRPMHTRRIWGRRWLIQTALVGMYCASSGCAGQRAARQAEGLAAQGRYAEAIIAFQQAAQHAPAKMEYAQRLAAVKSQAAAAEVAEAERRCEAGELDAALAAYQRAAKYEETARIRERIRRTQQERSELALQLQNLQTLLGMRRPADVLRKCQPLLQKHLERSEPSLTAICAGAGALLVDTAIARAQTAEQSRDLAAAYKIMKEVLESVPGDSRAQALAQQYGQKVAVNDFLSRGKAALLGGRYAEAWTLLSETVKLQPAQREAASLLEKARDLRLKELLAQSKEASRRSQSAMALLRLEEARSLAPQGSRHAADLAAQISAQRLLLAQALLKRVETLPSHSEGAAWAYRRMAQLLAPTQYANLDLPELRHFMMQRLYIRAQHCTPKGTPPGVSCAQEESPGAFHAALEQALASELRERSGILRGLVELSTLEQGNIGLVIDVLEPTNVDTKVGTESVSHEYVERIARKPNPAWEALDKRRLPLEQQRDTLAGRKQAEELRLKTLEQVSEQQRSELGRWQAQYDTYAGAWNQEYERKLLQNNAAQEPLRAEISALEESIESKQSEYRSSEDEQQRTKLSAELDALRVQQKRKADAMAELKQKQIALKEEQQAGPPPWSRAAELSAARNETERADTEAAASRRRVQSLATQLSNSQYAVEQVKAQQDRTDKDLAFPIKNTYWHHVNLHTHRAASTVLFTVRDKQRDSVLPHPGRAAMQALGVRSGAWPEGTYTGIVSGREEVSASDKSSERVTIPGEPPLLIPEDKLELPSDEALLRELAIKLARSYVPRILPLLQHPSEPFWVMARYLAQQAGDPETLERQLHFWVLTYHGADLLRDEREGRQAAVAAIRQIGLDLESNQVNLAALATHLRSK